MTSRLSKPRMVASRPINPERKERDSRNQGVAAERSLTSKDEASEIDRAGDTDERDEAQEDQTEGVPDSQVAAGTALDTHRADPETERGEDGEGEPGLQAPLIAEAFATTCAIPPTGRKR